MTQSTIESVTETITKCRNGSMDDKQFKATVEHNISLIRSEERKLCNSGRRMYQQGMKDERTRCIEIVREYSDKYSCDQCNGLTWSGVEMLFEELNTNNK